MDPPVPTFKVVHYGVDASTKDEMYVDYEGVSPLVADLMSRLEVDERLEIEHIPDEE